MIRTGAATAVPIPFIFRASRQSRETHHVRICIPGGSFIFLGVIVLFGFAAIYGLYTIKGSAINKYPNDGLDGAPGSAGPSTALGKGRSSEDHGDGISAGGDFSTHATQ